MVDDRPLDAVFMGVAQVFINAGFATALIRKQDRNETDFSTVFYYNFSAAVFLYTLLFFAAPLIAEYYKIPLLSSVIRIVGLNMIITSLSAIHSTKLTIAIDFKTKAKISLVSVLVTGLVSIFIKEANRYRPLIGTDVGIFADLFTSNLKNWE